ncbi:MAG: D-glycero-beta-D-manno-heptose 1-phosphate adenylyltransferase [Deltaproteobacteria bacterium]|nr:D-glycero-beta-D-manno-heptose 1-phosphate adenylyltransferase [Deltaproteobacteria bacterium]
MKEREELKEIIKGLKEEGRRTVFTNGCFDILHRGHVIYLEEARRRGDCLIVGVNSDSSVRQVKGEKRPIVPQEVRMAVLAALEVVDYVVSFDEPDPFELVSYLRPHILVKGGDWDEQEVVGRELVEQTIVLPYVEGASTSGIIETIIQRYSKP